MTLFTWERWFAKCKAMMPERNIVLPPRQLFRPLGAVWLPHDLDLKMQPAFAHEVTFHFGASCADAWQGDPHERLEASQADF